jgi:hypothetical protein
MSIEQIQERMDELAGKLNDFRIRYNRYPVHGDFKEKRITPSRAIFYKVFSDMEEATRYAEDLWIKERFKSRKIRRRRGSGKKQEGFLCPCCGQAWVGVQGFFNMLREAIKQKLLYVGGNSRDYRSAILELLVFLFGTQEIESLGYNVEKIETNYACFCGGKFKPNLDSSFKVIVTGRLLDLIQGVDGKSPSDAAADCGEAIFGKNKELH